MKQDRTAHRKSESESAGWLLTSLGLAMRRETKLAHRSAKWRPTKLVLDRTRMYPVLVSQTTRLTGQFQVARSYEQHPIHKTVHNEARGKMVVLMVLVVAASKKEAAAAEFISQGYKYTRTTTLRCSLHTRTRYPKQRQGPEMPALMP